MLKHWKRVSLNLLKFIHLELVFKSADLTFWFNNSASITTINIFPRYKEVLIISNTLRPGDVIVILNLDPWWRHQMETFAALLAICAGNSPVPGEFPAQRPVTRSFDVFFDLRMNKRLSKQSWGWWSETPDRSLWRQCNDYHSGSGLLPVRCQATTWTNSDLSLIRHSAT